MAPEPNTLSDIVLTPHGLLRLEPAPPPSPWADPKAADRIAAALEESPAAGLLLLAGPDLNTPAPPAAAWWREFARHYLTRLCHVPDLEQAREVPAIAAPERAELELLAEGAPPMRGGEYLGAEILEGLWTALDQEARARIAAHPQGAGPWLRECHPLWRMVGRVTFHLAENKRDPARPFAFMASYASRISSQSRVQHLPLGRALEESSGAGNTAALLHLLAPVQKAAEKSALVKELVQSNRVYKAIPLTTREAWRFLNDATLLEAAGLIVRLPDWWKAGRPPRAKVSVRIGQNAASGVGADSLLDFTAEATLDGEPLSPEEWRQLMQSADGLVMIRGRWVEADPARLQEALAHWKKVEAMARNGRVSFYEGMRLLSGFQPGSQAGQEASPEAPERAWSGVEAGPWLSQVLGELRNPPPAAPGHGIPGLNATLRPYQEAGVNWLWFLCRLGLGGCLADDMGLGKTIQVLALLLKRRAGAPKDRPPSLLVAPASLLANWRAEIERFAPSLPCVTAHPSETPDPAAALASEAARQSGLVLTTYGMLARTETLRRQTWDIVVLDEAQAVKNAGTRQARAVKELQAACRLALTGTPVENRASDLWSIFDFINPGLLGSATQFARFIQDRAGAPQPDYGPLRALTRPYLLRRLKTDKRVIADLPEKTEMQTWCSLSKRQAAMYQKAVEELAQALETADGIQRKGLVLSFILRFKQICNHPAQWLGDGAYAPPESGKFIRLEELAEPIAQRQEKALVFTQFREMSEPLAQFLGQVFGRLGLVLHGGTTLPRRREMVEAFQRDEGPPFFVLTVKAGGSGLNLTQAAHVIHFDRWWNPAVENQATDRAFRIGQKQNVLVHKFICRGTVEERIDRMIEDKKALSAGLLEGGGEKLLTEMNNEELLRFVALDLSRATAS